MHEITGIYLPVILTKLKNLKNKIMERINVYLLANAINAVKQVNSAYSQPHEDLLSELLDLLPSGSGIDAGIKLNEYETKKDRIVFNLSFHHMDENGYYCGWSDHNLIITPSLTNGFDLKITGRNVRDIKEYLYSLLDHYFYYDSSVDYYTVVNQLKPVAETIYIKP